MTPHSNTVNKKIEAGPNAGKSSLKVCFVIATLGHGRGGHFWDVKTLVEALSERIDCVIVNIGPYNSPVIETVPVSVHNISFNGLNVFGAARQLLAVLRREGIDCINIFDLRVFSIAYLANCFARLPLIFTKCGGPNPEKSFPVTDALVVFSIENLKYFQSNARFSGTKLHFLPNRVARSIQDIGRIRQLETRVAPDHKVFLMVARFCNHYKRNMIKGVDLIRRLNAEGVRSQLLIVGAPEDPAVVNSVVEYGGNDLIVITDEKFTHAASELIDIGDFVFSAGRGLMEAASRGKPLLTSAAGSPIPILVTPKTFSAMFDTNFSPRNSIRECEIRQNFELILNAVKSEEFRKELGRFSNRCFRQHFDVAKVLDDYEKLFSNICYSGRFRVSTFLRETIRTMRVFWPIWSWGGKEK